MALLEATPHSAMLDRGFVESYYYAFLASRLTVSYGTDFVSIMLINHAIVNPR